MSTIAPQAAVTEFLRSHASHEGHLGSIEVLDIDQLKIDMSYQRELVQALVDDIALAYDPLTAGVVLVSRRENGDLYIVDGQHKSADAQQAGNTTVLALVVNGLTQKEEAELRLAANVKRADTATEKFKARIVANDPIAIAITEIVTRYGTKVNVSPVTHEGINAVGALEAIYKVDGTGELLVKVFDTIQATWGTPEGAHALSSLLKGIAYFLVRHADEADHERLAERMRTEGSAAIRRMGMNHRVALGGAIWLNVYRAMVEIYNYRLAEGNKLEWKTGGWTRLATAFGGSGAGYGN